MTKILTQRAAAGAKAKEKRYTIADGMVPGLNLVIQPTRSKCSGCSAQDHRDKVALTIGDFALTTLADARAKAKAMLVESTAEIRATPSARP